jgi:hypothetical protein
MTTITDANELIRARLEGNVPTDGAMFGGAPIKLRWHGDNRADDPLPDTPTPFAFTVFDAARSNFIEHGGGRGSNRHRNPGMAQVFIFTPIDTGLKRASTIAEQVKTLFLPVNESGVVVESATVYPGGPGSEMKIAGLESAVGDYFWSGCEVEFYCDQIG